MYKAKSYKSDGKNDCIFLEESTKEKPCWGEVIPDEDYENELVYLCKGHEFRFCNLYYKDYVKEASP